MYHDVTLLYYDDVSPDVVVKLSLKISSPGVAVLYPGPEPVARLLLAPLRLAGAVGHESVRLISDPLRLCARGMGARIPGGYLRGVEELTLILISRYF